MSAAFLSSASSTIRRASSSGSALGRWRAGAARRAGRRRSGGAASAHGRRSRGGRSRSMRSLLVGSVEAMVRRCSARPHPARGSGSTGRRRPRARISVAERRRCGPSRNDDPVRAAREVLGEPRRSSASREPARGDDREPGQLEQPLGLVPGRQAANASAERMNVEVRRPLLAPRGSASSVSTVYDGPGRSSSIRLTANAGLPAIASSTIASAVAGVGDRPARLVRRDAGRDEQHALEAERLARLLGDREVADVDRVERAAEDAQRRARSAGRSASVTASSQSSGSHSSSVGADPDRVARPRRRPARSSRVDAEPGEIALEALGRLLVLEVRLGGDPLDALAADAERRRPPRSTTNPSPMRLEAVDDDAGRLGRRGQLVGVGQQLGDAARSVVDALAGRRRDARRPAGRRARARAAERRPRLARPRAGRAC